MFSSLFNRIFSMLAANTAADDPSWVSKGTATGGVFGNLTGTAETTMQSGYDLAIKVGIGLLVISIIAVGISFVVNSSGSKTEQNKEWLMRIVIGGILIAGALTVTGIIIKMAHGLS